MHRVAGIGLVTGVAICCLAGCGSSSSSSAAAGVGAGAAASATGIGGVTIPSLPAGIGGNPLVGGSSSAGGSGVPSACSLVDSSTAAGIAGSSNLSTVVDQTTAFTSACSYADASSGASVSVSITRVPGGQVQAAMRAALASKGSTLQSVSGIGDTAAETSTSGSFVVAFTKGDVFAVVAVGGQAAASSQSKAEDLARTIAGKV